jgi:hypothetical protein
MPVQTVRKIGLGSKEVSDEFWLVSFMDYDSGSSTASSAENPSVAKVLPMFPAKRYPWDRNAPLNSEVTLPGESGAALYRWTLQVIDTLFVAV